ncbi:MAG TPA: MmcQ/YjbR family DNA-binding protein [Pseudomonas sp.]|nr:MmcQ/YjbR family DNA-binding protein [Pseudomonas sp.]
MDTDAVKAFCRTLPGAHETLVASPGNILQFAVDTRPFAYFKTSQPEQWRFSLRVSPERFLEMTEQPGIKPARYMHRFHWVTVVEVQRVPADYLRELIGWSYHKTVSRLSKKRQAELGACGS